MKDTSHFHHSEPQATYTDFSSLSATAVLDKLQSTGQGLSSEAALKRISSYGLNSLKLHQHHWWQIFLRQYKSSFIYLLVAAAALAFFLGEKIDALMMLIFVSINTWLGFFQEYRSAQALKALASYTARHASVIRDGSQQLIDISTLVPGDIIQLKPGDIVPADTRLIETHRLSMDESTLTGETLLAEKDTEPVAKNTPLHQTHNMAFSGTSVSSGHGVGVVVATGPQAYFGTIAKLTLETTQVSSFEKGMSAFSVFVLRLVGVTLFIVFLANLAIKGSSANVIELLIFSIALATAVIPEALPLVITFSLSRGALKLAKHKVVVKRLSAIEDLGSIEVLCTDKTGTITENKLTVANTFGPDSKQLLLEAYAASEHNAKQPDPFDTAIQVAFGHHHSRSSSDPVVLAALPFDPERKRNSVLVADKHAGALLIIRGAAEALLPHLKTAAPKELLQWLTAQELIGNRVIVVAHKASKHQPSYDADLEETGLTLTGAIAFSDPLKKTAVAAIAKAKKLGVTVKIITGDSPVVAGVIGQQVGLTETADEVITGEEFFQQSEAEQTVMAEKFHIFARFSPVQKHQLIEILQQQHQVGFLGEGINDAPALKSANVALVVHGASDIAREAADVILLNSSLHVIVDGIEEGRQVFANTVKYIKMTLASNFGNFYAVAVASLIIPFLPMLPIQILLVNLLSDFPLIAIATDSVDATDLAKPERYNFRDFVLMASILGFVSTIFDFIFFGLFYRISPTVLQTNWFMGSILTELVLLFSLRTRKVFFKAKLPSWPILALTSLAAVATFVIPQTVFGTKVFAFQPPSLQSAAIIVGIVAAYFVTTEVVKLAYYKIVERRS